MLLDTLWEYFTAADVATKAAPRDKGLTRSLTLWERGEQLAELCQHWLDRARERLSAAAPARSSDES